VEAAARPGGGATWRGQAAVRAGAGGAVGDRDGEKKTDRIEKT
jgi:hypothetical protein